MPSRRKQSVRHLIFVNGSGNADAGLSGSRNIRTESGIQCRVALFTREYKKLHQLVYVITATLSLLLSAIQLLMLIRAILSWFPMEEDSNLIRFIYMATEPVILPVRSLLDRFGLFEGMPIDMSFFITFMLISIIRMLL